MYFPSIQRGDPNNIFLVVYNNESSDVGTGLAMFWDLNPSVADTRFANQVRLPYATTTLNHLGHGAGVVAGRSILGKDYGTIQVYGFHPGLLVVGTSVGELDGRNYATAYDSASITNVMLLPANHVVTAGVATLGYFGQVTTGATNDVGVAGGWVGGHCLPIEQASGTFASTGAGRVKAFVKYLR